MGLLDFLPTAMKIIDKVVPDKGAALAAKERMAAMVQAGEFKEIDAELALMKGQTDTNIEEAKSDSLFKSGWRPWVGWIAGTGFGYAVVLKPILAWISAIYGWVPPPEIDTSLLLTLLGGMLGLGGMRTMEKIKGVAAK